MNQNEATITLILQVWSIIQCQRHSWIHKCIGHLGKINTTGPPKKKLN